MRTRAAMPFQWICSRRISADSSMERTGTRNAKFAMRAEFFESFSAMAQISYPTALAMTPSHARMSQVLRSGMVQPPSTNPAMRPLTIVTPQ